MAKESNGIRSHVRVLVVGLGVQGKKRIKLLGEKFFASVDPNSDDSNYNDISAVPVADFDAAFLCVPDDQKINLIEYCILHKKHILVEKPLLPFSSTVLSKIQDQAISAKIFLYTAYNHRFEPHFNTVRNMILQKEIGRLYSIRMFYGNGTSKLVKESKWRDYGLGVITDLAPHLLDTLIFWFNPIKLTNLYVRTYTHETNSPDHAIILGNINNIALSLEMTMSMWKNSFFCDIIGELGSIHITSLCKWGPAVLTIRKRVFPSGIPSESVQEIEVPDPTWRLEHEYFFDNIEKGFATDLSNDIWIANFFQEIENLC